MRKKLVAILLVLCLVAIPFVSMADPVITGLPSPRGVPPQICQEAADQ